MQTQTHARLRHSIEVEVERLIAMLDDLEPDPDLEDDLDLEEPGDLEPSIGWTGIGRGTSGLVHTIPHEWDLEADLGGQARYDENGRLQYELEDDTSDAEPYLGAFENHPTPLAGANYCGQTAWANSAVYGDLECNLADAATDLEHCPGDYDGEGYIAGGQGL